LLGRKLTQYKRIFEVLSKHGLAGFRYFLIGIFVSFLLSLMNNGIAMSQDDGLSNAPGDCLICHRDSYRQWGESAHNRSAFRDSAFQAVWERERQSSDCLLCHTTGSDPDSGTMGFEGVGCIACHPPIGNGDYNSEVREHQRLQIPDRAEDCAGCHGNDHALTYLEWEESAHSEEIIVDCLACHDAHSGDLIVDDTIELCGSCHFQPVPTNTNHMGVDSGCTDCHPEPVDMDNVHLDDGDEPVATCVECHMVTEADRWGRYLDNAGHTLDVELTACMNCHGELHIMQPRGSD
jgi:predicted CXXCH cytochrome family protein